MALFDQYKNRGLLNELERLKNLDRHHRNVIEISMTTPNKLKRRRMTQRPGLGSLPHENEFCDIKKKLHNESSKFIS